MVRALFRLLSPGMKAKTAVRASASLPLQERASARSVSCSARLTLPH
jgi:hypothetical protein